MTSKSDDKDDKTPAPTSKAVEAAINPVEAHHGEGGAFVIDEKTGERKPAKKSDLSE